jgi:two-component system response regulator AtoC
VLVGRSPAVRRIAELITRVGIKGSPVNVLIRGESGTGKDVVARAIHARGPRRMQAFIQVNCTAMPEHLVESELFGHEKGAFTDAKEAKQGLFDLANRGTLFLDEIGDMPRALQAKLLQVLETHRFRRIGGMREIDVDVHVIAATNRNLEAAVATGDFREDLFYRLNVLALTLPPLRERPEDIMPLATHFIATLCRDLAQPSREISADAVHALEHYPWPGNARELRNVLERILLIEEDTQVRRMHLPTDIAGVSPMQHHGMVLPAEGIDLDAAEGELIAQAMERAGGNKTAAARLLGLSRDTLRYRLEKYGIA